MTKELVSSPEQAESELLASIVDGGKMIAVRLQQEFGKVFYPMKFIDLPGGKIAYSNPGGDYPMSLRMHQVIDGQAAGVEVSLFFKALPGTDGQGLRLFHNKTNKSSISDSSDVRYAYHFIEQNVDGSLAATPGSNSAPLDIEKLKTYSAFVAELAKPLDVTL